MQRDYNISMDELRARFNDVSKNRKDLIEFIISGGQKKYLLWHKEEDDTIKRYNHIPNHHLMKMILRLKGPERIERRLKFLEVM